MEELKFVISHPAPRSVLIKTKRAAQSLLTLSYDKQKAH